MNKPILTVLGLALAYSLTSCGGSSSSRDVLADSTSPEFSVLPEKQATATETGATNSQPVNSNNVQAVIPAPTSPANTSAGLNPEHGKPGHRCEIPVGAPLNSKATTTATNNPVVTNQPVVTTQPAATTNAVVPKDGLNPAHGQPGHVCGIPVGSPLNGGKAPTPSITPGTEVKQVITPTEAKEKKDSSGN